MRKLKSLVMPSCREVAALLASGDAEASSWWGRVVVRFHLSMCAHCSLFARQLKAISQVLRGAGKAPSGDTASLKRRVVDRLRSL